RTILVAPRWSRWGHVVKEAVVLVVIHDQDSLAPDFWFLGQNVQQALQIPGSLTGHTHAGVFAVGAGGHNPADLWQLTHFDVIGYGLQKATVRHGVAKALVQGGVGFHLMGIFGRR